MSVLNSPVVRAEMAALKAKGIKMTITDKLILLEKTFAKSGQTRPANLDDRWKKRAGVAPVDVAKALERHKLTEIAFKLANDYEQMYPVCVKFYTKNFGMMFCTPETLLKMAFVCNNSDVKIEILKNAYELFKKSNHIMTPTLRLLNLIQQYVPEDQLVWHMQNAALISLDPERKTKDLFSYAALLAKHTKMDAAVVGWIVALASENMQHIDYICKNYEPQLERLVEVIMNDDNGIFKTKHILRALTRISMRNMDIYQFEKALKYTLAALHVNAMNPLANIMSTIIYTHIGDRTNAQFYFDQTCTMVFEQHKSFIYALKIFVQKSFGEAHDKTIDSWDATLGESLYHNQLTKIYRWISLSMLHVR